MKVLEMIIIKYSDIKHERIANGRESQFTGQTKVIFMYCT